MLRMILNNNQRHGHCSGGATGIMRVKPEVPDNCVVLCPNVREGAGYHPHFYNLWGQRDNCTAAWKRLGIGNTLTHARGDFPHQLSAALQSVDRYHAAPQDVWTASWDALNAQLLAQDDVVQKWHDRPHACVCFGGLVGGCCCECCCDTQNAQAWKAKWLASDKWAALERQEAARWAPYGVKVSLERELTENFGRGRVFNG